MYGYLNYGNQSHLSWETLVSYVINVLLAKYIFT